MLTKEEKSLMINQEIDKLKVFKSHIIEAEALYKVQDPEYPSDLTLNKIDIIDKKIQALTNMLEML
jgi:hypothetical protein